MIGLLRYGGGVICLVLLITCLTQGALAQPQTYAEHRASQLIMIPTLHKIDPALSYNINQTVLLGYPSGPDTRPKKF